MSISLQWQELHIIHQKLKTLEKTYVNVSLTVVLGFYSDNTSAYGYTFLSRRIQRDFHY